MNPGCWLILKFAFGMGSGNQFFTEMLPECQTKLWRDRRCAIFSHAPVRDPWCMWGGTEGEIDMTRV